MWYSRFTSLRIAATLVAFSGIASFLGPASAQAGGASSSSRHVIEVRPGQTLIAKATIYPNCLDGQTTASGETFHQNKHTAASNKLPLGTRVKVTNLKNGKSTRVTTTDHGPALGAHKIDLSKRAAEDIGLTRKQGTVPVEIKVTHAPNDGTNR